MTVTFLGTFLGEVLVTSGATDDNSYTDRVSYRHLWLNVSYSETPVLEVHVYQFSTLLHPTLGYSSCK